MFGELFFDVIRMIDYYLVYELLNIEVFDKTENAQMQTTGFALFAMYVLFILRKFIFWLNIILVQKMDLERWEKDEVIEDVVDEIATGENFRKLKTLIDNVSFLQSSIQAIQNSHPKDAAKIIENSKLSE